jgi:IS6 family transposase
MSEFKWRHFEGEIILWAVRWYCRYGISYRDLEQMMGERGVPVDHSTIYRWVQKYAPEIEKRLRWQWRRPQSTSWRVDETYVKVRGTWVYLYRALDKHGNTIDFYLSPTRNSKAAKRFLGKAHNGLKAWKKPEIINTDKAPTYGIAISELKAEGKCPEKTVHRQVKYLNNVIEADHGKLKQLIRQSPLPVRNNVPILKSVCSISVKPTCCGQSTGLQDALPSGKGVQPTSRILRARPPPYHHP